jgi:hypothetical protein
MGTASPNFCRAALLVALIASFSVLETQGQWTLKDGPYGGHITALYADNSLLLAGTDGSGIFQSNNSGETWHRVKGGLYVNGFSKLGSALYAGAFATGVFKSLDNGETWTSSGLDDKFIHGIFSIGTRLIVGAADGIFLSGDNGASWSLVNSTNYVYSFVLKGNSIYAISDYGVLVSDNEGSSWTIINGSRPGFEIETSGDNLFVGNGVGEVFQSSDNGVTWNLSRNFGTKIGAMIYHSSNLYIGTSGGGIYATADNGTTWESRTHGLTLYINSFAKSSNMIYTGTTGPGVHRSDNNGQEWTPINTGLSSGRIFAMERLNNDIFVSNYLVGLAKSIDGGNSFQQIGEQLWGQFIDSFASIGNHFFAGLAFGGVAVSHDSGATWANITNEISSQFQVNSLVAFGSNLLAGTYAGGVFVSTDLGQTWTAMNNGLTNLSILCLTKEGSNLVAGTSQGGVFVSFDGGLNWTPRNNGLSDLTINALAAYNHVLYAATDDGLFKSSDLGISWASLSSGLSQTYFKTLEVTDNFIVTSSEYDVYVTPMSNLTWTTIPTPSKFTSPKSVLVQDGNILLATTAGLYSTQLPSIDTGHFYFKHPVGYSKETQSIETCTGDIDGNGLKDIVYLPAYSPHANIYFQDTPGNFRKSRLAVGLTEPGPFFGKFAQLADVNHDGKDDLIVVHNYPFSCNRLFIYLSEGSTFKNPVIYQINTSVSPTSLLVKDLDHDNELDILVGCQNNNGQIFGFKGIGNGTFNSFTIPYTKGMADLMRSVDLNADGHQDLVIGSKSEPLLHIVKGFGNLTFQYQATLMTEGFAPSDMLVEDFNNDGFSEIVSSAPGNNSTLSYFINNGEFSFTKTFRNLPTNFFAYQGIQAIDLHQDGVKDFVVGFHTHNTRQGFMIFENSGAHSFTPSEHFINRGGNLILDVDVLKDNPIQLATLTTGFEILVHGIQSAQNVSGIRNIPIQITPYIGFKLGDLNRDGFDDLVVGNIGHNTISVHINKGDGAFLEPIYYKISGPPSDLELSDINKDGFVDIVYISYSPSIFSEDNKTGALLGSESGVFTNVEWTTGIHGPALGIADFNHDGNLDIIRANSILFGNGSGGFTYSYIQTDNLMDVVARDFDHDGHMDFSALVNGQGVKVFFGKGDGTFFSPVQYPFIGFFSKLYAKDTNKDTFDDLYFTIENENRIVQLVNGGDRTFEMHDIVIPGPGLAITFNDFNLDGKQDLACLPKNNSSGSRVHLLMGNSAHTFEAPVEIAYDLYPSIDLQSSDLNRDGLIDIVTTSSNVLSTLFGTLTNPGTLPPTENVPPLCPPLVEILPQAPVDVVGVRDEPNIKLSWVDRAHNELFFVIERMAEGGSFSAIDSVNQNQSNYTDFHVEPDLVYSYRVRAVNAQGPSVYSNVAIVLPSKLPPGGPSNLNTQLAGSDVNLNWIDNAIDEFGFVIERKNEVSEFQAIDSVVSNITSYLDENVVEGQAYYYRIRAYNSIASGYSNIAYISVPFTIPATPSQLISQLSGGRVALTWQDNASNETGIIIERKVLGGTYVSLDTVQANGVSYTDNHVSEGITYYYRIRTYNQAGVSDYSNVTFIDVPVTIPATPTQLNVQLLLHVITLAWQDIAFNEDGYRIERKEEGGVYIAIDTVAANVSTFLDNDINEGQVYSYRVMAFNVAGSSPYSNEKIVPVPIPAPSNLIAEQIATGVRIKWVDHAFDEMGYTIEKKTAVGNFVVIDSTLINAKEYLDVSWEEGQAYSYRVRAFNALGYSDYSNIASITIPFPVPQTPSNLTAQFIPPAIQLTWQDNSDNELGFVIQKSKAGGGFQSIDSVLANIEEFQDPNWAEGETYSYRVASFTKNSLSPFTNVATVTVPIKNLSAPESLQARVNGKTVHINWTDDTSGELGYVLERAVNFGEFVFLDSVNANKVKYEDSHVEFGLVYTYRIYAFNETRISDYSNQATVFVIAPPFPNPSKEKFCIELPIASNAVFQVSLTNSLGALVPSNNYEVTGPVVCIFIEQLDDGVYYLFVRMNNQVLIHKVIKGK